MFLGESSTTEPKQLLLSPGAFDPALLTAMSEMAGEIFGSTFASGSRLPSTFATAADSRLPFSTSAADSRLLSSFAAVSAKAALSDRSWEDECRYLLEMAKAHSMCVENIPPERRQDLAKIAIINRTERKIYFRKTISAENQPTVTINRKERKILVQRGQAAEKLEPRAPIPQPSLISLTTQSPDLQAKQMTAQSVVSEKRSENDPLQKRLSALERLKSMTFGKSAPKTATVEPEKSEKLLKTSAESSAAAAAAASDSFDEWNDVKVRSEILKLFNEKNRLLAGVRKSEARAKDFRLAMESSEKKLIPDWFS